MTPKCGISLGHRDSWMHENIVKEIVLLGNNTAIIETIYGDKYKASRDSVERSYPVRNKHVKLVEGKIVTSKHFKKRSYVFDKQIVERYAEVDLESTKELLKEE